MSPQQALDCPRFCITPDPPTVIQVEEGISPATMEELRKRGHSIDPHSPLRGYGRLIFGKGQIIARNPRTGVLCAGSDPRGDGMAIGY